MSKDNMWNRWGEQDAVEAAMKNYKKGDDPLFDILAEEIRKEIDNEIIKAIRGTNEQGSN